MYILIGMFGALTFQEDTLGDILRNYSNEGGAIAAFIEAIFAFSICMTYRLLVYPMRDTLDILVPVCLFAAPGREPQLVRRLLRVRAYCSDCDSCLCRVRHRGRAPECGSSLWPDRRVHGHHRLLCASCEHVPPGLTPTLRPGLALVSKDGLHGPRHRHSPWPWLASS